MLGIVATLKIKAGSESAFEAVFKDLQAKVRANEPGCLQYDFFRSKKDPQTYVMMEQYATAADLDAHGKSDHFKAGGAAMFAHLDGAPVIQVLDKVS